MTAALQNPALQTFRMTVHRIVDFSTMPSDPQRYVEEIG